MTSPNVNCIGYCPIPLQGFERLHPHYAPSSECEYFLDPKAIWLDVDPNNTNIKIPRLHHEAYINGIVATTSDALVKGFQPNKDNKTTISSPDYVRYTVDKAHSIALFQLTRPEAPASCGLNIGIEITDHLDAGEPDGGWTIPNGKDLAHYHKVTHKKFLYHVVTKQLD